jgi:protocatechuate 3,4-dioxygenase beta subunit
VLACRLERGARSGPTLVVAPWITVRGLVRAEDGAPIEGAELVVAQPKWLSTERTAVLDDAVWHEPVVESDFDGRFALERTLAVEGTTLHVLAHGFDPAEIPLPTVSTEALEIVLLVPDTSPAAVRGQVVDSRGRGVAGACVSLGYNAVSCDANGGFRVDVGHEGEFDRLLAVHPGYLPALLEHPTDAQGKSLDWPGFVVLELGGQPLALAGRVIDSAGEPQAGWRVWLADPTFFSHVNQRGIVVEGMLQELDLKGGYEAPSAAWPWTRTDAEGRFELGGLLEREYELDLYHEPSRLLLRAGPFAAGRRDVEIVVDLAASTGPVAGRVVDPEGLPLVGVEVQTYVQTYVIRHDTNGYYSWGDEGPTATTDDEGRFRFEHLPRQRLSLRVQHPDVIPSSITLGEDDEGETVDPDDVTLVCERRFHIKVETDHPGAASVEAFDASGERIQLNVYSANGHMQTTRYPLVEGKSEALAVSGSAHELALLDAEGNELARRVLVLEFGVLNQVRF